MLMSSILAFGPRVKKNLLLIRLGEYRLYNYLLNRDSYATTNITMWFKTDICFEPYYGKK